MTLFDWILDHPYTVSTAMLLMSVGLIFYAWL